MSLFLKLFDTTAEYNAYTADTANFIKPNVSLCEDTMNVAYHPYVAPTPSYESVDLGLPSGTKWAKYNVGATSETEYGNYYQYGKGAAQYAATSGDSDYSGTENPLATSADTAAQVWGGNWHTPTTTQFMELTANTIYQWSTINGISGGKFTAQNGNYIFIPAAGGYLDGSQTSVGEFGSVWLAYSDPSKSNKAYNLYCVDGNKSSNNMFRRVGLPVRPVMD